MGWAYPWKKSEDARRAEAESACPSTRSEDAAASVRALQVLRPEQPEQPALPSFRERERVLVLVLKRLVQLVQQRPEPALRDEGLHFRMTK